MFRKRQRRNNGNAVSESLARAETDRRTQERQLKAEQPVKHKLDRLIEDNHLAELIRAALGGNQ